MKKLILISIIIFVGLFSQQCSEDFLVQPPQNTVTADSFWESDKQVEMAVSSVYNALARLMGYNVGHLVFGDVAADDLACHDPNWFVPFDVYTLNSTNIAINGNDGAYLSVWTVMYATIFRANWVIQDVHKASKASKVIKERSINEARFLRALAYFNLINIFGDIPFYKENLSANEAFVVGRTDAQQIIEFIEKELQLASGIDAEGNETGGGLPEKGEYELGRATKGAALSLLARVYLYQEKFSEAERTAKKVIDLGNYDLYWDDYGANWDNLMKNGIESVFEMQYKPNVPGHNWGENPGCNLSSFIANPNFDPNQGGGWVIMEPEEHMDTIFETNEEGLIIDKRREMSIFMAGDQYEFAPPGQTWFVPNSTQTGLMISKYIKRNHFDDPPDQNVSQYLDSDMNIPVIRYAEVLLIYAEALYRNGKTSEAFDYLNMIRRRAGLPEFDGTEDFMEKLMHERRMELFAEGHRFFDLRRWGLLEEILGPMGYDPETKGLFPLPQGELELNRNLTQNPGY